MKAWLILFVLALAAPSWAQTGPNAAELQAVRDATNSLGPFLSVKKDDPDPTGGEAANVKDKIETLAGQLFYLDSLMKALDGEYKKFLSAHPHE